MTRLQQILSAILVVQIILAAVVFWPRTAAGGEAGSLFEAIDPEEVVRVVLEGGDGTRLEFARQDLDWVLASGGDYPVDGVKVRQIVTSINNIQTDRLVASTGASHQRLQVAGNNFAQRIEIETSDGETRTLYVGSSPNFRATHVRRANQDETYLTGELTSQDTPTVVSNWIDTAYLTIPREEALSLVLENDNGTIEFTKAADGSWSMAGLAADEEFNESAFSSMLGQVLSLRMTEPLGTAEQPAYGLDAPQAVVTVRTEDEEGQRQTYTLRVGAQDAEDNTYFVKASNSDYYVKVSGFSVERMVNSGRDAFIAAPTPPPEGAVPPAGAATPTAES